MTTPTEKPLILDELITADLDIYELLSLTPQATPGDIRKAYRKTALKYHPDKNPSPDAAQKFHLLTVASDTLLNESLRKVYDRRLEAKLAKQQKLESLDREKRRMREDLERRENEAMLDRRDELAGIKRHKSGYSHFELDKLRSESVRRKGSLQTKMDDINQQTKEQKPPASSHSGQIFDEKDRTVRVKWRLTSLGFELTQNSDQLKSYFSQFGDIDHMVVLPIAADTTKKLGTGLIIFKQMSSAYNAVGHDYNQDNTDIGSVIRSVEFTNKPKVSSEINSPVAPVDTTTKPDVSDLKARIAAKLAKLKDQSAKS